MAQLNISQPVGDMQADGSPSPNLFDDVLTVQYLLNRSPGPGKPAPPLPEDGAVTPQLIAAIRDYEGFRGTVDGRIDADDATMVSLNAIALSDFEGVTDPMERRSIIQRSISVWNFTRGDFKTLTEFAGLALRFDPSSIWLPNALKARLLTLFNVLLKPSADPAPTWGVSSLDWYHCHLGLWSGTLKKRLSSQARDWSTAASSARESLALERKPFLVSHGIPAENVALYRAAYAAWVLSPDVAILLNSFVDLAEGVMVHHTFEDRHWRPTMESEDPRRHWMVDASGAIETSPYRTPKELDDAFFTGDFLCEGTIQINFLIDETGVIHPVLGDMRDLSVVTGLSSDALFA